MRERNSEISALLDGELEDHAVREALDAVTRDPAMRDAWQTYALIGDTLRGDSLIRPDMTANVMARISEEPVVLAPRNLAQRKHQHPLLALAASVAGVTVVGWLAFSAQPQPAVVESRLAAVSPAPTFAKLQVERVAVEEQKNPVTQHDLNEYLLAHQTQAAAFRLGHGSEHVRTVALPGRASLP